MLVKRYLIPSDYPAEEAWRLVDWCKKHGADEFTIDCLGSDSDATARVRRRFEKVLEACSRAEEVRERMSGRTADDLTRLTELWEVNRISISALQQVLPAGLMQYEPHDGAWFENPIFYRDGDLMLGVLSHEAFAVLRVSEIEAGELASAGFISHDSLPRVD